jgi:hypothetical protein
MGKFAAHFYFAAEAHDDEEPLSKALLEMTRERATRQGYHPTGDGDAVIWYGISDFEVRLMPESGLNPGDWRVRAVVGVAEEEEINSPEGSAEATE